MKDESLAELPVPPALPRGIHRERSTYEGYSAIKAVDSGGVVLAYFAVHDRLLPFLPRDSIEQLEAALAAADKPPIRMLA